MIGDEEFMEKECFLARGTTFAYVIKRTTSLELTTRHRREGVITVWRGPAVSESGQEDAF